MHQVWGAVGRFPPGPGGRDRHQGPRGRERIRGGDRRPIRREHERRPFRRAGAYRSPDMRLRWPLPSPRPQHQGRGRLRLRGPRPPPGGPGGGERLLRRRHRRRGREDDRRHRRRRRGRSGRRRRPGVGVLLRGDLPGPLRHDREAPHAPLRDDPGGSGGGRGEEPLQRQQKSHKPVPDGGYRR